jgi:hypothetical protein
MLYLFLFAKFPRNFANLTLFFSSKTKVRFLKISSLLQPCGLGGEGVGRGGGEDETLAFTWHKARCRGFLG